MQPSRYSFQDLWTVLEFLAVRNGLSTEHFIDDVLAQISRHEKKIDALAHEFMNLSAAEKKALAARLRLAPACADGNDSAPLPFSQAQRYSLEQLKDKNITELVKKKPSRIWINQVPYDVKSWKDASVRFVEALIASNSLRKELLPFFADKRSRKAFVNFFPGQPNGSNGGLFVKVADNFYVDIKHNAKYHVLNMWRSLHNLNLLEDWRVELEFKE